MRSSTYSILSTAFQILLCGLSFSDSEFQEIVVRPAASGIQMELYDANPDLIGPNFARFILKIEDPDAQPERRIKDLVALLTQAKQEHKRIGTIADGVSHVVLRARATSTGRLKTCAVEGGEKVNGKCSILFDGQAFEQSGQEYTFALYTPPEEFGAFSSTDGSRPVNLQLQWERTKSDRKVILHRPPVVLVHGTYDNPKDCWNWDGVDEEYKTISLKKQLENHGFGVYLVDFSDSNGYGTTDQESEQELDDSEGLVTYQLTNYSHFRDNAEVVWYGGQLPTPKNRTHGLESSLKGQGIKYALEDFRKKKIAATQADVVGHSLGGVLIRVYAKGTHITQGDCTHPTTWGKYEKDWFRRLNNFNQGDINRIITIGSTHMGSHIPGILQYVPGEHPIRWQGLYWKEGQFNSGAYTDQIPGSLALLNIGPTTVPSHAIAGVATVRDLKLFKGYYLDRLHKIWDYLISDQGIINIFSSKMFHEENYQRTFHTKDSTRLGQMLQAIHALERQYKDYETLRINAARSQTPLTNNEKQLLARAASEMQRLQDQIKMKNDEAILAFWAATFWNDLNDLTVSLNSALGGLTGKYKTIIPLNDRSQMLSAPNGVLHSWEPRFEPIQRRVFQLLEGGMENFDPNGFPASTEPRYYDPDSPEAFKPKLDEP